MERPKYIEVQRDFAEFKKGDKLELDPNAPVYVELLYGNLCYKRILHVDIFDEVPNIFKEIKVDFEGVFEEKTGINPVMLRKVVHFLNVHTSSKFKMDDQVVEQIIKEKAFLNEI